jgi:hypothetical protein
VRIFAFPPSKFTRLDGISSKENSEASELALIAVVSYAFLGGRTFKHGPVRRSRLALFLGSLQVGKIHIAAVLLQAFQAVSLWDKLAAVDHLRCVLEACADRGFDLDSIRGDLP